MPNIKFNYRYRDGSNYKNHGFVIFNSSQNIKLGFLQNLIKSKLIDETYFYASKWNIPNLFFPNPDLELGPTWHEFESIELTTERHNTLLSLTDFIKFVQSTKPIY